MNTEIEQKIYEILTSNKTIQEILDELTKITPIAGYDEAEEVEQ